MQQLSLFRGVHDTQPRPVTLEELVTMMRTDQSVRDLTEKHRYARTVGDEQGASRYKKMMTSFGVAARFEGGRQLKHIVELTGLSLVDIDHIPAERMGEVLALVCEDPHTLLAYTTLSGHGLRVITRFALNDDDDENENLRAALRTPPSQSDTHDSVVQGTALPSLSTAWHLANPLKASFAINRGGVRALQASLQNNSCKHPEGAPHRGGRREGASVATVARYESATCDEESFSSPEECALAPLDLSLQRSLACEHQRAEGVCWGGSNYKQAFLTINEYYQRLTGLPTDGQCKNVGRISTIAYDEELYYNPEATPFVIKLEEKKPVGRPKGGKSEKGKGKSGRPLTSQLISEVLAKVEAQGIRYEAGSYNRYVCSACYEMNRQGVSEKECREWAVNRFADYDAADVASIVRSCYLQTEEHGTARPPRADKESRYASIKDIQDWLRSNDIRIRHNVITRKREMAPLLSPQGGKTPTSRTNNSCEHPEGAPHRGGAVQRTEGVCWGGSTELTDQHVNSLYCRFCLDTGRQAKISDFYIIIESDFYPEYHPMRDFLEGLPAWDGTTDYIDELASRVHVTGCTQEMHNRYFRKWFVAMVAAWIVDGVTNHEILTYIGPQGIYKSTFMRLLLPPELRGYFSARNFANRMTKDDRLELTEMGLIALEELDHMKLHELNQLKAITTDPTVNERAAYARYRERREHIASFCGTGNNARFLTDLTSNRRWLPFMVESIDSPYDTPIDYVGLYAQAYTLWRQGFRYWFDEEENAELEVHNQNFEEPNLELELIQTYFRPPGENEVGEFYTASRIIETICVSVKTPLYPRNIAIWMNKLGYRQRRRDNMRGWNVVLLTATDIKQRQQENARLSSPE